MEWHISLNARSGNDGNESSLATGKCLQSLCFLNLTRTKSELKKLLAYYIHEVTNEEKMATLVQFLLDFASSLDLLTLRSSCFPTLAVLVRSLWGSPHANRKDPEFFQR